jgi:hypothetical protein
MWCKKNVRKIRWNSLGIAESVNMELCSKRNWWTGIPRGSYGVL